MLAMMAFFMLVSFIYPILFPPPPQTKVPAGSTVGTSLEVGGSGAGPVAGAPGWEAGEGGMAPLGAPEAPPREIKVTTPLYEAIFTESGGRLRSFKLRNYYSYKTDPDAPESLQELVNAPYGRGAAKKGGAGDMDFGEGELFDPEADLPFNLVMAGQSSFLNLKTLRFTALESSDSIVVTEESGIATLTFRGTTGEGIAIERTLTFHGNDYVIGQEVKTINLGDNSLALRLGMDLYAWPYSERQNRYNVMAAYINRSLVTETADDAQGELSSIGLLNSASFLGYMDQYFLSAHLFNASLGDLVPDTENLANLRISAEEIRGSGVMLRVLWPLRLKGREEASYKFDSYMGPKDGKSLEAAGHDLTRSVDLGWFAFLARPLGWLLRVLYGLVGNYGVAIILTTILIKILLWPLTAKSYRSMKEMQKIQPQVKKLREKYKDDPKTMNKEMMQLYKTFKVSPLGGCLPMILQIPFFFAFYRVLDYALELRGAPFALWITDLSAPDRLFHFNMSIPFISQPTGIPVLTLLMGATMIWQQKMTPSMGDPMQAKMMMLLPIIFIVALLNMPSGLVLYWLVNNILSIFQQKLINRKSAGLVQASPEPKK
jgi:YidC/Oxa1 family membrane protein insertase